MCAALQSLLTLFFCLFFFYYFLLLVSFIDLPTYINQLLLKCQNSHHSLENSLWSFYLCVSAKQNQQNAVTVSVYIEYYMSQNQAESRYLNLSKSIHHAKRGLIPSNDKKEEREDKIRYYEDSWWVMQLSRSSADVFWPSSIYTQTHSRQKHSKQFWWSKIHLGNYIAILHTLLLYKS